eukprot:TRINITY_DN51901_c0_g1_i1.p1 TRINITY_DN51901_c0_g1~~TRINITY_DN51901_c0_g1_i1.p1  ORF type:complete len:117 (+),score=12.36 TRINITY_DN51901_c0_g1_i1:3-353(+)
MQKKAKRLVPEDIDSAALSTLSMAAQEQLQKVRPANIGQAGRLGGVNPADVSALLIYLEVQQRKARQASAASEENVAAAALQDVTCLMFRTDLVPLTASMSPHASSRVYADCATQL